MSKNREIEMKQHVLELLKNFMMGEEGGKFKPKAIEVAMVGKPKESLVDDEDMSKMDPDMKKWEESAEDRALDKAEAEEHHVSEDEWEGSPEDEEADEEYLEEKEKKPRMSLKDFLASRSE